MTVTLHHLGLRDLLNGLPCPESITSSGVSFSRSASKISGICEGSLTNNTPRVLVYRTLPTGRNRVSSPFDVLAISHLAEALEKTRLGTSLETSDRGNSVTAPSFFSKPHFTEP